MLNSSSHSPKSSPSHKIGFGMTANIRDPNKKRVLKTVEKGYIVCI